MLVLSRKEGESVVIDNNIVVTIVRLAGGKVRLGIDAPPHVSVRREELAPLAAPAPAVGFVMASPKPICLAAHQ